MAIHICLWVDVCGVNWDLFNVYELDRARSMTHITLVFPNWTTKIRTDIIKKNKRKRTELK